MKRAIYTYCNQCFDEAGGGWGFYSYSNGLEKYFESKEQFEELFGSLVYTIPENNRVWLRTPFSDTKETYEIEQSAIEKYHPEMFSYQKLKLNGTERISFIYAKNLGREIKAVNRPGNKVVYSLLGSDDEITDYPCFYAENQEFQKMNREFFKQAQEKAQPLSEATPHVGKFVTRQSVHSFLKKDSEREDLLVTLFYALVQERSKNHRPILICDKKENIIFWIAAVTLLFPLEIAKKIFFTTYDYLDTGNQVVTIRLPLCGVYSPTLNDAPECHATNYAVEQLHTNDNIVLFDMECGILPEVKTNGFEKIIREFSQGNEELLLNYHKLIIKNTNYRDFGVEYTLFCCPVTEQAAVFPYYIRSIQERIFDEAYPSLFDLNTEEFQYNYALNLTKIAMQTNLITENQLYDDLSAFTMNLLKSPSFQAIHLKKAEPAFQLIDDTTDDVIKRIILQNPEQAEKLLQKSDISVDSLIYLANLFEPYKSKEFVIVQKICGSLRNLPEGEQVLPELISKWFNKGFVKPSKPQSPEFLLELFQLSKEQSSLIKQIISCITKWSGAYTKKVIQSISHSEYAPLFFQHLEQERFSMKEPYSSNTKLVEIFSEANTSYTERFCDNYFEKLAEEESQTQKKILEQLLTETSFSYDDRCSEIAKNVLKTYAFEDADELAQFSLFLYSNIKKMRVKKYPVTLIFNALQKCEGNKRKWKKAVNSAELSYLSENELLELKRKLLDDINVLLDSDDSSENKKPLKEIMEKFMEKFKKK